MMWAASWWTAWRGTGRGRGSSSRWWWSVRAGWSRYSSPSTGPGGEQSGGPPAGDSAGPASPPGGDRSSGQPGWPPAGHPPPPAALGLPAEPEAGQRQPGRQLRPLSGLPALPGQVSLHHDQGALRGHQGEALPGGPQPGRDDINIRAGEPHLLQVPAWLPHARSV